MGAEFDVEVAVIGGGPAGLSAGLNLVRARRRTVILDASRPRNAATLHSHGFLSRDGVPPLELRRLGRDEFLCYDDAAFHGAMAVSLVRDDGGFVVAGRGVRGAEDVVVRARAVLIATGLVERLPAFPSIRAWYGTDLHSCMECDGWEKSGQPLALIGESADLADRAVLLTRWSDDVIVFTNGSAAISSADEARLASRGIRVERRPVADVPGVDGHMTGVLLEDGELVPRTAGFVRPSWSVSLAFLGDEQVRLREDGLISVDVEGRTTQPGLYAAGDTTPPGPEQLIVAAGEGARVASTINRDLIGGLQLPPMLI